MSTPLVEVRLLRVPVAVYERASLHQQALQREFDVISSTDTTNESFPSLLLSVVRQLEEQFGRFGTQGYAELEQAVADQREELDLTYEVPREAAEAARQLGELLDQADDHCRTGTHLLTLATPDEALAFRRWFLGQFIDQIDGADPTPWTDWVTTSPPPPAEHRDEDGDGDPTAAASDSLPDGWALESADGHTRLSLSGELDLETASALRNALQEAREQGETTVTVDGRAVTFIDSLAISVVIAAWKRLVQDGVELRIEAGPAVFRTLQIAGLVEPLGVVEVLDTDTSGDAAHGGT